MGHARTALFWARYMHQSVKKHTQSTCLGPLTGAVSKKNHPDEHQWKSPSTCQTRCRRSRETSRLSHTICTLAGKGQLRATLKIKYRSIKAAKTSLWECTVFFMIFDEGNATVYLLMSFHLSHESRRRTFIYLTVRRTGIHLPEDGHFIYLMNQ